MYRRILILYLKILIKALRVAGSSGSAMPGLVMERLCPSFLVKTLKPIEKNIILITGTNGKTTTTKMVVEALRSTGKRVVTNGTGSNMTRGIIAALIDDMTYFGNLMDTSWFVFEVDEAYAPIFTKNISPKALVALNVLRDQLDRYGEIDTTAKFIADAAKKADLFIYNALDPLLSAAGTKFKSSRGKKVITFGAKGEALKYVINEQTLHSNLPIKDNLDCSTALLNVSDVDYGTVATIQTSVNSNDSVIKAKIPLQGFHNAINLTAVTCLLYQITPNKVVEELDAISKMSTPFGRGERLILKGKSISVALVKNPSGFTSNLTTFVKNAKPGLVLFVINDKIADGRDVSWLWDVNFKDEINPATKIMTSGIRGYDMALRLQQDGYESDSNTDVKSAIDSVFKSSANDIVIIPTYTALFEVRSELSKYGRVARIW